MATLEGDVTSGIGFGNICKRRLTHRPASAILATIELSRRRESLSCLTHRPASAILATVPSLDTRYKLAESMSCEAGLKSGLNPLLKSLENRDLPSHPPIAYSEAQRLSQLTRAAVPLPRIVAPLCYSCSIRCYRVWRQPLAPWHHLCNTAIVAATVATSLHSTRSAVSQREYQENSEACNE